MLSTLEEVSLHQQNIREISGLETYCRHLKILYLQNNLIEEIGPALRKMKELEERQDRMFNWEDRVRKDEDKILDQFRKQKEEMMAKKLAEQQKEILRDMAKEDVDALLAKHKRQLL